jgi:hypothetical protein
MAKRAKPLHGKRLRIVGVMSINALVRLIAAVTNRRPSQLAAPYCPCDGAMGTGLLLVLFFVSPRIRLAVLRVSLASLFLDFARVP